MTLFLKLLYFVVIFCMFPFCHNNRNLNFFVLKGYSIENILELLAGLQFDIYVIKTRVGFKIGEMTIFLNYIGSYSFALRNS